jgi:putative molybdopterin biosynthesis protein
MRPGLIYDSNGRILCDALREIGAEPVFLGTFRDDEAALRRVLADALQGCDGVLLSGGTSKGEGDLCYRVVSELDPGIQVHGVALKPGKPICLASAGGKPVAILPGFPTSAVFTFHELVAPLIRRLAGRRRERRTTVRALLAQTVRTAKGRLEYLLVNLVRDAEGGLVAFPMGKGSGSVTAFSRADGFIGIDRTTEIVDAGTELEVTLLGREFEPADLVVIGSHCLGLDVIARQMARDGFVVKLIAAGSQGGLAAATRGECDVAPIHLLDAETDEYNRAFLGDALDLVEGYRRMQGVVTRQAEARATAELVADDSLRMVNRNRGSGTRVLIDQLLGDRRPDGYSYQPRSHHAVAAAVAQGRADWGVTIETVALQSGLRFRPLREEHYDFAIPRNRLDRPAVQAFLTLLRPGGEIRAQLEELGFSAQATDSGCCPDSG